MLDYHLIIFYILRTKKNALKSPTMKPNTMNDQLTPLSRLLFERMMAETFVKNKLGEHTSYTAQRFFFIEKFLTYFAKQKDIDLDAMLYDKKFVRSKLRFHVHHFWLQLAKFIKFPHDNKIRYSEALEILWQWYYENKDEIDELITIPRIQGIDEKYKKSTAKILRQLCDKLNSQEYKINKANRNNVKNSNVKKITHYINRLSKVYLDRTVIRIELGYQKDSFFDVEMSEHMTRFHRDQKHKPVLFKNLCGYITKLEYSDYNGYYWRVLLFFYGLYPEDSETYSRNIGEYWNNIIVKKGGDYQTQDDYLNVKENGIELLEERLCATFFRDTPLEAALYLCEKDAICRPNVNIVKLLRTGQISNVKKPKVVPESVPRGRKRHIDPLQIAMLKQQGLGATEIAKQLDISRSSVCKILKLQKSS